MFDKLLLAGGALLALGVCSSCSTAATEEQESPECRKQAVQEVKKSGREIYFQAVKTQEAEKRAALLKEAFETLQEEADRNDLESALLLACMYDLGQGVKQDGISAAKYYRIAADGGLKKGKIALARFWHRNEMFLDDAAKQIESIPDYQKDPDCLLVLGMIRYAQYQYADGFQYLLKAYQNAGRNFMIRESVWKVIHSAFLDFYRNRNYDAALAELDKETKLNPKHPAIPYCRGLVAMKKEQRKEAEAYFNEALRLNPADPFFYRERAFLHAMNGKKEEALDDIKVAIAVSGNAVEFIRGRIELYYLLKDMDGLVQYASGLLKQDGNDVFARISRAGAYMLQRNYETDYLDYIKLSETSDMADLPEVQEGLAVASSHLDKLDDAEKAYEKLLKKDATPVTQINLAELYIVRGKYAEALKLLDSDTLLRSADKAMKCISSYLAASARLASGGNAEEAMKTFYGLLPQFKQGAEDMDWDTALFEKWLRTAKLPPGAGEKIADMTRRAGETFRLK